MGIINCKKCGKMFNYITGNKICPACKEEEEAVFQKVKKFVQDNKKASMDEICAECEVEPKLVKQWIREERLFFADDSPVKISCERCGCQISSGRFCDKCKKEAAGNFENLINAGRPKPVGSGHTDARNGIRMHTRDDA